MPLNECESSLLPLLSLLIAHIIIDILPENFSTTCHGKGAGCFDYLSLHRLLYPTFILYRRITANASLSLIKYVWLAHLCIIQTYSSDCKGLRDIFRRSL